MLGALPFGLSSDTFQVSLSLPFPIKLTLLTLKAAVSDWIPPISVVPPSAPRNCTVTSTLFCLMSGITIWPR